MAQQIPQYPDKQGMESAISNPLREIRDITEQSTPREISRLVSNKLVESINNQLRAQSELTGEILK